MISLRRRRVGDLEFLSAAADLHAEPTGRAAVQRVVAAEFGLGAREMEGAVFDAIYLAVGFAFLAVAILYVTACDRL
jgi:hypothetical protein